MTLSEALEACAQVTFETEDDPRPALCAVLPLLTAAPSEIDAAAHAFATRAAAHPLAVRSEAFFWVMTGEIVEQGADPALGWAPLQARLGHGLAVLAASGAALAEAQVDLDSGASPAGLPPEVTAWCTALPLFVIAAMARLSRSAALRAEARHPQRGFVEALLRLSEHCEAHHVYYLTETLSVFDGDLLLIDVEDRSAEHLQLEAIRNCAHLFALLEGVRTRAVLPGRMESVARHYATFGGLDEVSAGVFLPRRVLRDVDWIFMLGVEVQLAAVPMIELPGFGRIRVVVVGPARLGHRSYEAAGFYSPIHDALIERVVQRRYLRPEELEGILPPLLTAARKLRAALGRKPGGGAQAAGDAVLQHPAWIAHWSSAR